MKSFEDIYKQVGSNTLVDKARFESIYKLCNQVRNLEGSAAEVGVYKGGTAYMISRTLDNKPCYFFDTFEGLPEANKDIDLHNKGDFADVNEAQVRQFLDAPNVRVIKGFFPDTGNMMFSEHAKLSFVHLDVDLYQCTLDGLEFFYPKMVPGGIIVTDDWEWKHCPGVKKAFDEFLKDKPEKVIPTVYCQAYIQKQ